MAQVLKNSQIIFHTFQCSSFQGCFPPNTPVWPKSQALRWYNRNRGTSTDNFFNRVTLSTSVSEPCQSLWWSITESVPQASKTPRSSFTLLHPEFLTLFLTLFFTLFWHSFFHWSSTASHFSKLPKSQITFQQQRHQSQVSCANTCSMLIPIHTSEQSFLTEVPLENPTCCAPVLSSYSYIAHQDHL